MKPFTQTADTLDQELADKIDGILAAHGEDPTQLVGILLDVEAAVERHYIPGGRRLLCGGAPGGEAHPGLRCHLLLYRPSRQAQGQVYPGGVLLRPLPGEGQRHPAGAAQAPFKSGGGPGDL